MRPPETVLPHSCFLGVNGFSCSPGAVLPQREESSPRYAGWGVGRKSSAQSAKNREIWGFDPSLSMEGQTSSRKRDTSTFLHPGFVIAWILATCVDWPYCHPAAAAFKVGLSLGAVRLCPACCQPNPAVLILKSSATLEEWCPESAVLIFQVLVFSQSAVLIFKGWVSPLLRRAPWESAHRSPCPWRRGGGGATSTS